MGNTKKVKMAGRFGSRYGAKVRQRLVDVETEQRKKHKCPKCEQFKVKRIAAGLFKCRKCGAKFSGGAYTPETNAGTIITKMVQQKQFFPLMKELLETNEASEETAEMQEAEEEKPKKEKRKGKKKESLDKAMLADKVEEGLGEDESEESSEGFEESAGDLEEQSAESEEAGDDSDV